MNKRLKQVLSLLIAIVLLWSTAVAAMAAETPWEWTEEELELLEDTDESENEEVAPGVWSDDDPYFTEEVPEVSDFIGPRRAPRSVTYPTYAEAYETLMSLQKEYPEGLRWTNFEPYGSLSTSTVESDKIGYIFLGGALKGARYGVGCAALVMKFQDTVFGTIPIRVMDEGNFTFEDLHVSDFLRIGSHFVIILKITPSGVVVAEGNYNKSVHWGRTLSKEFVMFNTSFAVTRYPAGYSEEVIKTEVANGTEGSLNWSLSSSGVLTISGSGAMDSYDYQKRPSWESYKDKIYNVVIEDGITTIGDRAFYQMTNTLEVNIPNSVNSIGIEAFGKSGLIAAVLPSSVEVVGSDAFRLCENLASVTIPEGVKTVGERAFHSCTSLQYVEFPSTLTRLGGGAFHSCQSLNRVVFVPSKVPGSLTIGNGAFYNCWYLNFVSLPEGLTELPPGIFSSCKTVYYLYIPSTVASLAEAGQDSPFTSSYVGTIYFGGTEAAWNTLVANLRKIPSHMATTLAVIENALVYFDKTDPFAPEPAEDPGDIQFPCENGHVGEADENGNCTVCGDPWTGHTQENCPNKANLTPEQTCNVCGATGTKVDPTESPEPSESPAPSESPNPSDEPTNTPAPTEKPTTAPTATPTPTPQPTTPVIPTTKPTSAPPSSTPKPVQSSSPKPSTAPTIAPTTAPTANPDGSTTTVTTDEATGTTTEVVKRPDGSGTITVTQKDNTMTIVEVSTDGVAKTTVKFPADKVAEAQQLNKAVALPLPEVAPTDDASLAPGVTIHTESDKPTKVAIPVTSPGLSTVAVIVNDDGSTKIVKASVTKDGEVVASLPNGVMVKIINNNKGFSDVRAGSWHEDAVTFAAARELFAGTSTTTFSPAQPMTRGMLMTVLARFADVDTMGGKTWYDKSVEWAKAQGISDGTNPNGNITREQLVTMLWRYMGSPKASRPLSHYADAGKVSNYAQEAMSWATENGVMSGYGDGRLGPKDSATRAQTAQMLKNLIEKHYA